MTAIMVATAVSHREVQQGSNLLVHLGRDKQLCKPARAAPTQQELHQVVSMQGSLQLAAHHPTEARWQGAHCSVKLPMS